MIRFIRTEHIRNG